MSTAVTPPPADDPVAVSDIEAELARRVSSFKGTSEGPVLRARMSNLMIYCDSAKLAEEVTAVIPAVAGQHPARVLLLVAEATADTAPVKASVKVWSQTGTKVRICTEQVTLRAAGDAVSELAFAVRGLLIGDLPINLWWAAHVPPALGGAMLSDLAERAQQVIYDSIGWLEPARGVAMMATWLGKFEREPGQGEWSVASDLNWRRLKYWRRLLGQALDPATAPGALTSITDVYVEHGPRAVVQAWELVSWLAARLGWQVRQGRVQPGVEIGWETPGGGPGGVGGGAADRDGATATAGGAGGAAAIRSRARPGVPREHGGGAGVRPERAALTKRANGRPFARFLMLEF